ncbi:MAG: M1 family aminopeptidase [Longimicrobiales bacterium]
MNFLPTLSSRFLTLLFAALAAQSCGPGGVQPAAAPSPPPSEPPPVEAGIPAAPGEYALAVDIQHYDIELALGAPTVQGRVDIQLATGGATELPLDFTGLAVAEVTVDGEQTEFQYEAGKLRVPLPAGSTSANVGVRYEGTPDDGLIIRPNVHGNPAVFVDNWPNRTRFWLPTVDHPGDKATASFTAHAPAEWQVIANGAQVGEPTPADASALGGPDGKRTWRWATQVLHPTYTLVFGATEFRVQSLGRSACGNAPASQGADGCVDVSMWVYPEDAAFGAQVFDRAPEMMDFFTDLIGPYPFEKLANVQSATRFGGMENSSAIFYSEQAMASGQLSEGTVSHEIAHQWFGDSATQTEWSQLWLSEGFATYFGALFFEEADGTDDFRNRMETARQSYLRSGVTGLPVVGPAPANLFQLLNANSYEKGGWVLHMLRGLVGDEAFFEGIRRYYATYAFGNATTDDLREVMEGAADRPLDWFFQQWVFEPGYPVLESEWEWDDANSEVVVTIRQTQVADWPTFRLPITIEIHAGETRQTAQLEVTSRSETFRLPSAAQATDVVLDPAGQILRGPPGA